MYFEYVSIVIRTIQYSLVLNVHFFCPTNTILLTVKEEKNYENLQCVRKQLKTNQNILKILSSIRIYKINITWCFKYLRSYSFLNYNKMRKSIHDKSSEYPML